MKTNKRWVLGLGLFLIPMLAQSALLLRTIDGVDLYYDTVLDLTWHSNANLAATQTFDVAGINVNGTMNWSTANAWTAGMNTANYLGFDDWRLPTLSPINGTSFTTIFSNNATTDRGNAKTGADGGWRDGDGEPVSEMGHMHYVNLANLGECTPDDADPSSCVEQDGWGLANTSSFDSVQAGRYWLDPELSIDPSFAWSFDLNQGLQVPTLKIQNFFAWAVVPGDVAAQAVSEPGTLALLLAAVGVGAVVRRRRTH